MEDHAGHIVVMATECIHFPCFVLIHAPQFNQTIVCTGHNQRQRWMETGPVHTTIVAFEDVFDNGIGHTEQISCTLQLRQIVQATWSRSNVLFAQTFVRGNNV